MLFSFVYQLLWSHISLVLPTLNFATAGLSVNWGRSSSSGDLVEDS